HHPPAAGKPHQNSPDGVTGTESTGATRPLAPGLVPAPDRCWNSDSPAHSASRESPLHALTNPPLWILDVAPLFAGPCGPPTPCHEEAAAVVGHVEED